MKTIRMNVHADTATKAADVHSWVASGPSIYSNMLHAMGIENVPAPLQQSDDDMLLQAHLDKTAEREEAE